MPITLSKWVLLNGVAFTVGLIASAGLSIIAGWITQRMLRLIVKLTDWEWDDDLVNSSGGPLMLAYFAAGILVTNHWLDLPAKLERLVLRGSKILGVLAVGWAMVRLLNVASRASQRYLEDRGNSAGAAMIPIAHKFTKPAVIALVVVMVLQNAGMNVGGLLAGLGIGGLALAMASKTTLENVLGGLTIAFDRPFKVGDFVRLGDLSGNVETVGLRSTRIRTMDRSLVTIPNHQVIDSRIENFAARDRIRFSAVLTVVATTKESQLQNALQALKAALLQDSQVWPETHRIRLLGYSSAGIEIEVFAYVSTVDFAEFCEVRERLLFRFGQVLSQSGVLLAFPAVVLPQPRAN